MTIVVTGATGHLGRLVVLALLDRGVRAATIVATGRNIDKLADLAARGVTIRHADYDDPAVLSVAFAGADKVLLVSAAELGRRVEQHGNAVDAARRAGAELLAYTSAPRADHTRLKLAAEHAGTETYIRKSGLPFVFLRNSWYTENYTARLASQLDRGEVLGAAGDGRVSAATRRDFAEAAAAVLVSPGQAGKVYELGGDDAFTLAQYAAEVSRQSGRPVIYRNLDVEEYTRTLIESGLPRQVAEVVADSDAAIARGELFTDSGDLCRLINRPTTPLGRAVAAALR
jgi:NAD(P)H dehydrogenase (quinone)